MPIQPKQQPPYYNGKNPTKIYLANITGSTPPIPTQLINTYGETLTWARFGTGTYTITTIQDQFEETKTSVIVAGLNGGIAYYTWGDTKTLTIETKDLTGTLADDLLGGYTTILIISLP